jgi:hypothetical protein
VLGRLKEDDPTLALPVRGEGVDALLTTHLPGACSERFSAFLARDSSERSDAVGDRSIWSVSSVMSLVALLRSLSGDR